MVPATSATSSSRSTGVQCSTRGDYCYEAREVTQQTQYFSGNQGSGMYVQGSIKDYAATGVHAPN